MKPIATNSSTFPSASRREFLWNLGGGLGGVALAQLLADGGLLAAESNPTGKAAPSGGVHHPAKAQRVVQFFMSGAASQCDIFDYKPELIKRNGQPFDPGEKVELFQSNPGDCMASPWDWKQYGQCGKWMSDLVPQPGQLRRRHGVHPLDGFQVERARPGHVHAEHRLCAARLSQHGRLGLLRPGQPDRQPADLCRAARCPRLSAQRARQLERRFPARHAPGHD